MIQTPILDVAIALVFCFAAVALAASTVTEALASLLKLRANTLVSGLGRLLNDRRYEGLALQVYNHALVHPQGDGQARASTRWWTLSGPSYIPPAHFATALLDAVAGAEGQAGAMKARIDALPDAQLRALLQSLWREAAGDVAVLHQRIASWFDAGMERVSGGYKRQTQLINFLVGLGLAVLLNVDALHVMGEVWRHPALSAQAALPAAQAASASAASALTQLQTMPVGPEALPPCPAVEQACNRWLRASKGTVLGWLLTGLATLFGAPFWFDLLQNVVRLRGTGTRPPEPAAAKGAPA